MFIPRTKPITQKRLTQLESARNSKAYRDWKKAVFTRDENKCQYPGCNNTEKLEAHHIRPFSVHKHLRTQIFNGITLCRACHSKITNVESKYELLFFEIVKAKSGNQTK